MRLRPRSEQPRTGTCPRARGRSQMARESPSDRRPGLGREDDVAVVVQAEARVVRDLPRMPVEITESTRVPAVESFCGLACDRRPVLASLLDHVMDLVA